MSRQARRVLTGVPAHLMLQTRADRVLAADDADRRQLLAVLRESLRQLPLVLHAWVLRERALHLIVTAQQSAAPAALVQALGRRHVRALNSRHGLVGPLWQGRFRLVPLEPGDHTLQAQLTLETWPVLDGAVGDPLDSPWSSARQHAGRQTLLESSPLQAYWSLGNTPFEREQAYRALLDSWNESDQEAIRSSMATASPMGSDRWLDAIHVETGWDFRRRAPGRPRKVAVGQG